MPDIKYEYLLRFAEPIAPSTFYYVASTARSPLSTDTPNTYVPGGLPPLNFQIMLFAGVDSPPQSSGALGAIRIRDTYKELDYLIGLVFSGGTLQLLRGVAGAAFSTYSLVATLTTAGLLYNHIYKEIRVRDLSALLQVPLHGNRYGGTGGADGSASLAGVIKPYAIGNVKNITPTMIDTTKLAYQVSDGAIYSMSEPRVGGAPRTFGNNHANYAALDAATISAGIYDTCLDYGYFRLGSAAALPVTVDVIGDKSGTPFLKRGDIAKRIVSRAGNGLTTSQVNSTALTALNTAQPDDCGWFWNSEISKIDALNEVMEGCQGWWFINLAGELVLGQFATPTGTALATYTWPNDFASSPTCQDGFQDPRFKTILSYARNYTVMDKSQLAGSVSEADALTWSQEAQWITAEFSGQRDTWPLSPEVRKYGGYVNEADASDEATRQRLIFVGTPYNTRNLERIQVRIRDDPFTLAGYLGGVIAIASYDRFGWANPRKFFVAGIEFSGALAPRVTLIG